ncbi:MAG TPA: S-layer homology domain-containing protein [Firmicutes bacterium]|uniref:S-layer homology domain-containing protein n=1 Tax=Capillibacterium thermochitinicola TaxID=2699427 RepID=A0A8J6I1J3_9FIRM|nr:S-layer homology domain-containing protein [Capillibacterium thermochitinicola]MBA2132644.1 S-layer homology domain-containing protein [Capillibacterium thermochitinicola]HHW12817.1 S-layer homology domain-containing protein [Bacillota bacterium]
MRKVLVVLVSLAMLFSVVPVAMGAFEDMPKATHWAYDNFMLLYNAGLLKGYPDGTFKGERYATRYEMVELTARILKYLESQMYGSATLPENGGRVALTEAQAKELIRRALEEEQVATAADIDAIYDALWELEYELRNELDARSDVNVSLLANRVAALETKVEEQGARLDAVEKQTKSNKTIGIVALILGVAGIVFGFVPAN